MTILATTPRADLAPPPRWAVTAAHLAALATLPSGLWRVALAIGLPVDYSESSAKELFDVPGAGASYLIGLSVLLELLALSTLLLVRPWSLFDRFPRLVLGSAAVGSVALTLLWLPVAVLWWFTDGDGHLTGTARTLVGLTYVPLAAWGPLLGAVTWSYARRVTPRSSW